MTDETRPDDVGAEPQTEGGEATAVAEDDKPAKLRQAVEIKDVGPCKKHIKVTVERQDIDARFGEKFSELTGGATVAGFRPGKARARSWKNASKRKSAIRSKPRCFSPAWSSSPRTTTSRRSAIPTSTRPPSKCRATARWYTNLKLKSGRNSICPTTRVSRSSASVHTFTDDEVAQEERRLLAPHGQVVPKPDGKAEIGDILTADVTIARRRPRRQHDQGSSVPHR